MCNPILFSHRAARMRSAAVRILGCAAGIFLALALPRAAQAGGFFLDDNAAKQLKGIVKYYEFPQYQAERQMPGPRTSGKDHVIEGIFRLRFNAAGKCTSVEKLRSTGEVRIDDQCETSFKRWQVYPGKVNSLVMPIYFLEH